MCNNELGCRVNNLEEAATEKGLESFVPDVIVERECEFLKQKYTGNNNLLTENCEHFASKCRYGKEFSCQVNELNFISKAIVLISTLGSSQR